MSLTCTDWFWLVVGCGLFLLCAVFALAYSAFVAALWRRKNKIEVRYVSTALSYIVLTFLFGMMVHMHLNTLFIRHKLEYQLQLLDAMEEARREHGAHIK